ncbi:hypothetical protein F5884DRAFT_351802 [Xylogone sp. PMI_703]|nr:hypothetical protein F5884DRAFT_351802 [Xylogone sp. PMI_703]
MLQIRPLKFLVFAIELGVPGTPGYSIPKSKNPYQSHHRAWGGRGAATVVLSTSAQFHGTAHLEHSSHQEATPLYCLWDNTTTSQAIGLV